MNEDHRQTLNDLVGAVYGGAIIAAVIYLAVFAAGEGERNLLLGILGGGFGGAVSKFLGNVPTQRRQAGAGPTVNVESPQAGGQVDVNANAAPARDPAP